MKVRRESQRSIVPWKPGNRTRRDPVEGRGRRTTESLEGNMAGASKPDPVFTKQQRIAELARQSPQMGFTSLNHHLDLIWLIEAYNRTRKDGATGVDGQTAQDYGLSLLENLESLRDRAKSGGVQGRHNPIIGSNIVRPAMQEQHGIAVRRTSGFKSNI